MSFRAKCENCNYKSKRRGKIGAESFGAQHALRNPGHEVIVWGPDGQANRYMVESRQTTDKPPF